MQDKDQVDTGQSICEEMNHHYRNCRIFEHSGDVFAGMATFARFLQTLRQLLLRFLAFWSSQQFCGFPSPLAIELLRSSARPFGPA